MLVWNKIHGIVTLRCNDITRLMSDALERPLTRLEQLHIDWHKLHCDPCKEFEYQIRVFDHAMRHSDSQQAHPTSVPEEQEIFPQDILPLVTDIQLSAVLKSSLKERLQREFDRMTNSDSTENPPPQ